MVALKVEKIGDRAAVVLSQDVLDALNVGVGDVIHLEPAAGEGSMRVAAWEISAEDLHARGRAFLRRYNRAFSL